MRSAFRRLRPPDNPLRGHKVAAVLLFAAVVLAGVALAIVIHASEEHYQKATLWIALIGVWSTVLAIMAAYTEVRTVFPPQGLHAVLTHGFTDRGESTGVVFHNGSGNAIINAFRLEVRLEDDNDAVLQIVGRSDEENGWVSKFDDGVSYNHWIKQENAPFFPGTTVTAPQVSIHHHEEATHWRATWWTDRAGPQEVVLPIGD